ncbi:MAG: GyrI-like domain-containing protein [Bacteroidetes bacterium]|nr:GyrI-like domain-containing protein [Bacteroidota bacterium]
MSTTPQVKEIKPVSFLYYRTETSVNELINLLPVSQEIIQEAVQYKLPIMGAVHWHYFGFDGDLTKAFTLEVAVPVGKVINDYDGKFHFKRTQPFKCVCMTHEGSWQELPKSYGSIMKFISDKKFMPSSAIREVYVNADFENPEANVTEIQFGIQ